MSELVERLRAHLLDARQGRAVASVLDGQDRHWAHYLRRLHEQGLPRERVERFLRRHDRRRLDDFVGRAGVILSSSIAHGAPEAEVRDWVDRAIDRALGIDVAGLSAVHEIILDEAAEQWTVVHPDRVQELVVRGRRRRSKSVHRQARARHGRANLGFLVALKGVTGPFKERVRRDTEKNLLVVVLDEADVDALVRANGGRNDLLKRFHDRAMV